MRRQHRWTESYAREVLAYAKREGLSDGEVAEELGGSAQRVTWWRKRLERGIESGDSRFVEVRVTEAENLPGQDRPFVVQTSAGVAVQVWPGFEEEELCRLLRVLEEVASC